MTAVGLAAICVSICKYANANSDETDLPIPLRPQGNLALDVEADWFNSGCCCSLPGERRAGLLDEGGKESHSELGLEERFVETDGPPGGTAACLASPHPEKGG